MVTRAMALRYAGTSTQGTCGVTDGEYYTVSQSGEGCPQQLWCMWGIGAVYRIPTPYMTDPLQPKQWLFVEQHGHTAPLAPL